MSERIEGVPVGTKLARIGIPKRGEWIIYDLKDGVPIIKAATCDFFFSGGVSVIIPDNVYGVIDLSTIPIPEGWERDGDQAEDRIVDGKLIPGWFREIDCASEKWYIAKLGCVFYCAEVRDSRCITGDCRRIHVRPIKPKTRRVLVAEWPISADYQGLATVSDSRAKDCVESLPSVYHIEERPL